ncbi:MAG: hypothetical protein ACRYFX_03880 [Janthinobacterium lividum]
MASTIRFFPLALLAVGLGLAGYAGYRAQARRAAVLGRITALDACLAASNERRARAANSILKGISRVVCRCGHPSPADSTVLAEAQQIRARTQAVLDTLQRARRQLQATGYSVAAQRLPAQFTWYGAYLLRFAPDAPILAHPSARLADSGWLWQFDVQQEPKPAALALLTRLETQIRQGEIMALEQQAAREGYGCCDLCFDVIRPVAVPVSATVAPGGDYQARLFFALQHPRSFCSADLFANGRLLTQTGRQGRLVSFTVPAARPGQPDTVRAEWQGTIRFSSGLADTVLNVSVPYLIVKPPTP